ncbi:unnamed protein product [Toxocara canis]|uniref:Uncharacterized protein n=1 Tax=Toxocara canis TaxID=6265 RepID=A0A3P7G1K5_TOXCA|nr:unnamed protein product [Toxocara canis]
MEQRKLSHPSGIEVDLLITEQSEIIVLPHGESSPNMMLSRGKDELQLSASKGRRQSLGAGAFDISPRGSISGMEVRKHRRDSNKDFFTVRRDSMVQEFDARTSAPVYAV